MKKRINLIAITTSLATISITLNVFALETPLMLPESSLNFTTVDNSFEEILADEKIRRKRLFDKLNLDDTQKQKMQNIQTKYRPKILGLKKKLRTEQVKLREMMQNEASESQLRNQQQSVWQLDETMQNLRFDATLEMRKVLTPEQLEIWAKSREERELNANRRHRFGRK